MLGESASLSVRRLDRNRLYPGVSLSDRHVLLRQWLRGVLGGAEPVLSPASSDASFRRYWRLHHGGESLIAVDAPPQTENSAAFVRLAKRFRRLGLNVPRILAADEARGLLLVSDLGQRSYLDALDAGSADRLYRDAIEALVTMQAAAPADDLPDYDAAFLERELRLFDTWLLDALLDARSEQYRGLLDDVYGHLIRSALEQPRVCVHRDYHSRNLMVCDTGNPGILDFQDAVRGPVSYDLASLLKDCYVDWPPARIDEWTSGYLGRAVDAGVLDPGDRARFPVWLDLMATQRHLKAAGIFARLALRDGRPDYLQYLPRTLGYVVDAGTRHSLLRPLADLIEVKVLPRAERDMRSADPAAPSPRGVSRSPGVLD